MTGLAKIVERAIDTYNRYRSPMATADLVDYSDGYFSVKFEGPFCTTCCRDDYFEDLIYELKELGVDISWISIGDISQEGPEAYVVDYSFETTSMALRESD